MSPADFGPAVRRLSVISRSRFSPGLGLESGQKGKSSVRAMAEQSFPYSQGRNFRRQEQGNSAVRTVRRSWAHGSERAASGDRASGERARGETASETNLRSPASVRTVGSDG